jgi:N-acetylmuramidase/Putative peptidoglycan binding domain
MSFTGAATPLSPDGFQQATEAIGTKAPELWALVAVETSGCGFLADRRPEILYERHIFYRLTNGRFPISDINSPDPGGYAGGAAEYGRLTRAMALDQTAALESASWGIGQILGQNHQSAGFPDAATMVTAMCSGEDAQLLAVSKFLIANKLDRPLCNHDWSTFARGYNGPNYAKFSYDAKLSQNYQKYSVGPLPDLTVRAAQLLLLFLNYNPGGVDGLMGPRTESALKTFQSAQGIPVTGDADDATMAALDATVHSDAATQP